MSTDLTGKLQTEIPEISAAALAAELESGAALQLLDVRAPERLASGRIEPGAAQSFTNLPNSRLFGLDDPANIGLQRGQAVVTVCGHGHSSQQAAAFLLQRGYQVRSLRGGMAAWMRALLPRELPAPQGFTRLLQFDRVGKGALGYLLISGDSALVIDPPRDLEAYESAAEAAGARIVAVADTHVHADYISGAPALAAKLGVPYFLHPADNCYPYDGRAGRLAISPLSGGQEISVGAGTVRALHTPGHTEGSMSFIAGEEACFSGDFIFVDSIGRPDLAGRSEEWTPLLYVSLQRALSQWPDSLAVYPAHYAGEGERNSDRSIGASLGELRGRNSALSPGSAASFAQWVRTHLPTPPEAYRIIKGVNVGLIAASPEEIDVLEAGRNECAVR